MEVTDALLCSNLDWDPWYLESIFQEDFYDFNYLWSSSVADSELVCEMEKLENYNPIVEDISLDDSDLCSAVEAI